MKAYLITTGTIFGVITALHIWKVAAEWPRGIPSLALLLLMAALILIPAALALWAVLLLQKTSRS